MGLCYSVQPLHNDAGHPPHFVLCLLVSRRSSRRVSLLDGPVLGLTACVGATACVGHTGFVLLLMPILLLNGLVLDLTTGVEAAASVGAAVCIVCLSSNCGYCGKFGSAIARGLVLVVNTRATYGIMVLWPWGTFFFIWTR